jgi:NTE family protein
MQFDLVFEGGGAKGAAFAGAMEVFFGLGHTTGRVMGTSAGAITATLTAAGYTTAEMLAAVTEKVDGKPVFADFLGEPRPFTRDEIRESTTRQLLRDINLQLVPDALEERLDDQFADWMATQPALRHIFSFVERGGWFGAESFLAWLRRRLDSGTLNGRPRQFSGMTLAQFYEATQVELSLIGSDTTAGLMRVLNHRTAPDLPLVWATRISMSLPLVWQEVVWQAEWGSYRGKNITGDTFVDGGLLSNFPIELFVSRDSTVTAVMGPKTSTHVLGLLLDDSAPVPGVDAPVAPFAKLPPVQRIANLVDTTLNAHDKEVIQALEQFVVRLPAKGIGTTEFDMTDGRRESLLAAARAVTQEHFANAASIEEVSFDLEDPLAPIVDRIATRMLEV